MDEKSNVVVALTQFRDSFEGRIKINTEFDKPLYKVFRVIKMKTYKKSDNACTLVNGNFNFKNLDGNKNIVDLESCQIECNKDFSCVAFSWVKATKKCTTFQ